MGLDQYFTDVKHEDVFQLRKVNALHGWMERRFGDIQNCADVPLYTQDLQDLMDDCKAVIASSKLVKGEVRNGQRLVDGKWEDIIEEGLVIEDPSVAKQLMPVTPGFFFGRQQYDECYLNDLKDLVDMCKVMIDNYDDYNCLCYHAWW